MNSKELILKTICLLVAIVFMAPAGGWAEEIQVSQHKYLTTNGDYDRNPSIIHDGANYWLFYTKGDQPAPAVRGVGGYDPDADSYVVYYKTAATLAGLTGAPETKLALSESARPTNFDQRVSSATYFNDKIYVFVSSGQSGTDRGLYYYEYSGGSWSGPFTLIADATARGGHVNVTSDANHVYIVWESSDGSADCYTWDGTTLSSKIDISDDNMPKITLMGTTLYVVSIEDGTGDIEVYSATAGASPSFSSHSTAIPGAGLYDPCIFNDGTNLYVVTAPYDGGNDQQWLIQTKYSGSWATAKRVTYGGYDTTYWWDYWPCGYHDGTDAYLFFTTETESPAFSDAEIAYLKMDWDLGNDHFCYIQNAIDQANSGDFINVSAGTYAEYLHITTDNLTIEGAGIDQSIIDLDGLRPYWHYGTCSNSFASRAGVYFVGYGSSDEVVEDCVFRGFTVKNAGLNPPIISTGTHTGPDNQAILTDASASWIPGALVGQWVHNYGDRDVDYNPARSYGQITANTATTITATLSGGVDNDWDNGDPYLITPYKEFYNTYWIHYPSYDGLRGISIANGKNILIQNCKVTDCGYGGITTGKARCVSTHKYSEYITIDNCIVTDHPLVGINVGTNVGPFTITNNTCERIKMSHYADTTREYAGVGIQVSGKSSSQTASGTISGNTCGDNGFEGIIVQKYTDGVTVEDNTITGHNFDQDGAGIFFYHWGHPEYCKNHIIRNNTLIGNIRGIVGYYASNCTIEGNTVTTDAGTFHPEQGAIKLDGCNNITVKDNTISSDGIGISVVYWEGYGGVSCYNNTFTGNTITDANFAGIFISGDAHDNVFTDNIITGTDTLTRWAGQPYEETQGDGVFIDDDAGTGNVFHYNSIYDNADDGMENQITTMVDAFGNWWGDASGPMHPTTNPDATGDEVSDNVDYSPWWGDDYVGDPHTSPWNWYLNTSNNSTIQEGIDIASPEDTVRVRPGTYTENILMDKTLALLGAGQDSVLVYTDSSDVGPPSAPSFQGSQMVIVEADNVLIDGFTFDGDNPTLTPPGVLDARNGIISNYNSGDWDSLMVRNCRVKNIYLRGIYAAAQTSIAGIIFTNNTVDNVNGVSMQSAGIMFWGGNGVVDHNVCTNSSLGIFLHAGSYGMVEYNKSDTCELGIGVNGNSNQAILHRNLVTNSDQGIQTIGINAPVTILSDTIKNCGYGLVLYGLGDGTAYVQESIIDGSGAPWSLGVYGSTNVDPWGVGDVRAEFMKSQIINNWLGVVLNEPATDTTEDVLVTLGGSSSAYNLIYDSDSSELYLEYCNNDINATYNYWGKSTLDQIEEEIFHQVDNPSLGLVDFSSPYLLGDVTLDGVIDLADVVFLINYIYRDGPAPYILILGDTNRDEVIDIGDVVLLINYLYQEGPPPISSSKADKVNMERRRLSRPAPVFDLAK